MSIQVDKFRQMGGAELVTQESDMRDQLFRLRFQKAMGQNESLKKLRELRRDIARIKTLQAERQRAEKGK